MMAGLYDWLNARENMSLVLCVATMVFIAVYVSVTVRKKK